MFLVHTDYECPECHNQLVDEQRNVNGQMQDIKVCYSETCNRKWWPSYGWEEKTHE